MIFHLVKARTHGVVWPRFFIIIVIIIVVISYIVIIAQFPL